MNPKFFLGPMSKNIVDAAIEYCNEHNTHLGLIPSRRQVDYNGGYVNGWNTKTFSEYVRSKTKNILLVRDHCGPNQGQFEDDGIDSFIEDCKYLDVVHIDVWKKYQEYSEGLQSTISFIKLGYSINPKICFEVGTEQAIREFSVDELKKYLSDLKEKLSPQEFERIKYVVIQSGTALKENKNIGLYDRDKLLKMIELASEYNLITKEHNGDYLESDLVLEKFSLGLSSINIAPELGQIETSVILKTLEGQEKIIEKFYEICFSSGKWKKWVDVNFVPEKNKKKLIDITGHYVFSNPKFLELKKNLKNVDKKIKKEISSKISSYKEIEHSCRKNLLEKYFNFFSQKDIVNLSNLFDTKIKLVDWEIHSEGIDEVIKSNNKIFSSVDTIEVELLNIVNQGLSYFCVIQITINNTQKLDVVDIIEFNENNRIISIRAYKG